MSNQFEEVVIEGGENPGPSIEESHDALVKEGILAAEGDGAITEQVDTETSLDKFRDPETGELDYEALEKSYLELERKQSGNDEGDEYIEGDDDVDDLDPDDYEVQDIQEDPSDEDKQFAEEATKRAGLDLNSVSEEWRDNGGELSAETFEALEDVGYPREAVETYIAGLTSGMAKVAGEAHAITGGPDGYNEMTEWAAENLNKEEVKAYDAAVKSGNRATTLQAVRGMYAQYFDATDDGVNEPDEEVDARNSNASGSVYEHMDDYMADMNNPLYETSETYRHKVMLKLDRSNI